jgi:hypothetical protein
MDNSASDKYLLWERKQHEETARRHLELRQIVKHFVLVLSLVAITVAVATMLPR